MRALRVLTRFLRVYNDLSRKSMSLPSGAHRCAVGDRHQGALVTGFWKCAECRMIWELVT